jgi:hypothetical protein
MSNFISHQHGLIVIHIPKCGGSSVRKYSNIKFTERFLGYIPENYLTYAKIGFCRHPIDRFFSAYKMFKYGTTTQSPQLPNLSIQMAIDALLNEDIGFDNVLYSLENFKHHTIPITHPYNCIRYADRIVRFENYEHDVKRHFKELNISIEVTKTNYTNKDIAVNLTKSQKTILFEYYKEDFKRFNYN